MGLHGNKMWLRSYSDIHSCALLREISVPQSCSNGNCWEHLDPLDIETAILTEIGTSSNATKR